MKKLGLVLLFGLTSVSLSAMENSKPSLTNTAKAKALKQFNETLNRFKKCLHGKCTKMEALKVARDLGIAATAVIIGLYSLGTVIEKSSHALYKSVPKESTFKGLSWQIRDYGRTMGEYMQKPGQRAMRPVKNSAKKTKESISAWYHAGDLFHVDDMVEYNGQTVFIDNYNKKDNTVTFYMRNPISQKVEKATVGADHVTLRSKYWEK